MHFLKNLHRRQNIILHNAYRSVCCQFLYLIILLPGNCKHFISLKHQMESLPDGLLLYIVTLGQVELWRAVTSRGYGRWESPWSWLSPAHWVVLAVRLGVACGPLAPARQQDVFFLDKHSSFLMTTLLLAMYRFLFPGWLPLFALLLFSKNNGSLFLDLIYSVPWVSHNLWELCSVSLFS